MSLKHQDHHLQVDVQHDKVGEDADLCNAEYSLSFESTSSCNSRATSSRRGSRRTGSKLNESKADDLTLTTHSRQERLEKLKVHSLKAVNKEGFRGKQRWDGQAAKRKRPFLPPIKPQGVAVQQVMLASQQRINELGNQVRDLQQQLAAATAENRLLKRQQGRQEGALRHLKNLQDGLPQVLLQHNNEVHTLQELLRQSRERNGALVRQLHACEARLLNTGDALRKLQQLSQDRSLGERDELAQRVNTLTLELDLKNKRIQDLEKNMKLSNASFNRQLSSQVQKTHQARDISKCLQEEINQLKQKINEQVRLLEIRNIYSYRFVERPLRKAAKESKLVQTEQLCPVHQEEATSTPEVEHKISEDFEIALRTHISMESCNEQSYSTQEDPTSEYTETGSDESTGLDGPLVENITNLENISAEIVADDEEVKDTDVCEEKEVLLHLLENHTEAEDENTGSKVHEEELKPCQEERQLESSDVTFSPSTTTTLSPQKSSTALIRKHHYIFKETVQNMHLGKPAYDIPGRRVKKNCVPYSEGHTESDHLHIQAYEPSFFKLPPVNPPKHVTLQEDERAKARKRNLMKELFGKETIDEPKPRSKVRPRSENSDMSISGNARQDSLLKESNIIIFD
uniref:Lebercilin-like protein n=2 Tax=Scleropages formosus TaxID=113540 RepID=A0A8C9V2G8_SCLFO